MWIVRSQSCTARFMTTNIYYSPLRSLFWTKNTHLDRYTVKPDELVQLEPFEETDCLKSFKFINSNNLSIGKFDLFPSNSITYCKDNLGK